MKYNFEIKEKARADKLEKEYSKILTKIDEYEVNYIPASLLEETIEELKNEDLEIYDTDSEDLIIAKYEQRAILNFLQELLEKRK